MGQAGQRQVQHTGQIQLAARDQQEAAGGRQMLQALQRLQHLLIIRDMVGIVKDKQRCIQFTQAGCN